MLNVKQPDGTLAYVPGSPSESEMSEHAPAVIYVDTDGAEVPMKTKGQR